MSELKPAGPEQSAFARPVFISFAAADRKQALSVCNDIERRGLGCWISVRNVEPGENYQDAIVHAIRNAAAIVLVFSKAANSSDEIKKELSLASRYRVPVLALRIEDVEPSEGFAYELSTRQWIDAFEGWDDSIDLVVSRIKRMAEASPGPIAADPEPRRRTSVLSRRRTRIGIAASLVLLLVLVGGWWALRGPNPAAHSMTVRLAGFQPLSADLPAGIHDAVGSEVIAAFNADGVIGVSTAPPSAGGLAPAYTLGGTIHRVGNSIRVITRFTNERTGAILWSDSIDYPADQGPKIPHHVAVDAATVIRCGLFGASTYHKQLPDDALSNYMQYCQQYWAFGGSKTLRYAQLVVAAVPDFSWGWSAVANGFLQTSQLEPDSARAKRLRAAGLDAESKALALDRSNSEALAHKAYLIDPLAWAAHEALFKSAIAAKPLDCGCEHYGYGLMLEGAGRLGDAVEQYRAATDMLALWPDSQVALANALVAKDRVDEARPHFDAAIDLNTDPNFDKWIAVTQGTETGDYAAAIAALRDRRFAMADETRAALLSGYQALASREPQARAKAVEALTVLPRDDNWTETIAAMLGALGATHEALAAAGDRPSLFWRRSMRGVLADAGFAAAANRLGLLAYWKSSHTKPDVCAANAAPAFCQSI